mgnify:CR=1 FL=1
MLDPKLLRNDIEGVGKQLLRRNFELDVEAFSSLEAQRREIQQYTQDLQAKRNSKSKQIGMAKSKGEDISPLMSEIDGLGGELKIKESELDQIQKRLRSLQLMLPNLLDDSVPEGVDEEDNVELRRWGQGANFNFAPKDHVDLGEALGMLDFERAAKLSGSRFCVMKGPLARLQRALSQLMLDIHTEKHGYDEVYVPLMVSSECLYGTGQLHKFADDFFAVKGERDLVLIPTAEVPLANLHRDEVLSSSQLPLKYVSHTPCFRSEAGSYGKDTRGMIRQHQFQKVELVQVVKPSESEKTHDAMCGEAETILQLLNLPYRVVVLCSGDTGFAATKTYDIEVWMPSQNCYREISSVSNCAAFQSRRMQLRYRDAETSKPELLHTLNGSGVAVGRALVAVLENYQNSDGSVNVPEVLQPYMNGCKVIQPVS